MVYPCMEWVPVCAVPVFMECLCVWVSQLPPSLLFHSLLCPALVPESRDKGFGSAQDQDPSVAPGCPTCGVGISLHTMGGWAGGHWGVKEPFFYVVQSVK